jgi:hypothetical protein
MSIAKITRVQKAAKDQGECGRCGKPLPKGSAYRWFTVGFRSTFKQRRCMDIACDPKSSELESSKLAGIYALQEGFDVSTYTTIDDIKTAVQEVADGVREIADEYTEASINPNTGDVFNTDAEERAQILEGAADELDNFEVESEFEPCDDHEVGGDKEGEVDEGGGVTDEGPQYDCVFCAEAWEQHLEAARSEAAEAVDTMEMP